MMTRRILTYGLGLAMAAGLAACSGLPESAAGVDRPLSYDGTDYMVNYSVREVTEALDAPGATARFDATFIEIARADGQPMSGRGSADAVAIASAFCETYGLPAAPVAGRTQYSGGGWSLQNHCGAAFG